MNDKKDVALQLALEVLTQADADTEREPFEHVSQEAADAHYKLRAAIAAIRAALAEPGELVAAWRAVLSDASVTLIPADYRATTAARLLAAAWADLQSMHVAAEDAVRGADALIAELAERGEL